jgi:hypothetical protein
VKRLVVLAFVLVGTAGAAPRKKPKPKPAPAAPAPAPEPAPAPPPAPEPAAEPAPAPPPPAPPVAAPGSDAAPGASQPAPAAPPPAPRLAMRRAHDGFVDNMDCSACHTADGWNLSATAGKSGFDHDRTGFPLRGAHVQTTCTGCHSGAKAATNCEGCHRDPHAGRLVGACAECHDAVAWSNTAVLEQHRRTRMPLTGRHAMIDCSDCHKRQGARQFTDTPTDCFACHSASYHDATIHPTHDGSTGQAPFPRDCALCHQTSAWTPAYAVVSALPRTAPTSNRDHDGFFVLTTGSHRTADCASCHADLRRPQRVRCDGCHADSKLRTQHRTPIARVATGCLGCHPRGAAR